ncbi:hypothetical protein WT67_28115 [Burkholderia stagnalis]|uniref:Alpha/beta hydrolase n=1 Tax=Burkholderia stagnalis TaxID=1503054 RepID=A0A6L3MN82_9BURK|nr:hypothetical protein [Burkholderia stagnalis]KAB0633276.1 hypothetical protein F7R25_30450 [Burkholderia stagnalis]KVN27646.1 hypothetical protein WT11_27815 [Burkholderia stagnalis]KVO35098.1 hypothetical protein WT17_27365 [Burkholderia stagnalis]KVO67054.1 hypothetical protein WT19_25090 [Burkholderia stagnalis]KVW59737.1 hypothetical protein WT28_20610 [Burkholderia stagnalis]
MTIDPRRLGAALAAGFALAGGHAAHAQDAGAAAPPPGIAASQPVTGATIAPGAAAATAHVAGVDLPVFTYRPAQCAPSTLLVVFHGVQRNGAAYRDHAIPLAERLCAIVVAPQFDAARFPRDVYQYGGASAAHGLSRDPRQPRGLVAPLVGWARQASGIAAPSVVLLGHSAGAQFLDRVAAYGAPDVARIVIANPSTWVMPSVTDAAPFGFGGVGTARDADDALRAYLAQPITVLLGTADTGNRHLVRGRMADAQGPTRHARGLHAFQAARAAAESRGWAFGWRLVEVPGVGHDATRMFASPEALEAVQGTR